MRRHQTQASHFPTNFWTLSSHAIYSRSSLSWTRCRKYSPVKQCGTKTRIVSSYQTIGLHAQNHCQTVEAVAQPPAHKQGIPGFNTDFDRLLDYKVKNGSTRKAARLEQATWIP
eukprot:1158348-Pelagomonas_calceolata.AAC.3